FRGQVGIVLGAEVAVEIRSGIEGLAECVIGQKGEMRTKALLHFQDSALIQCSALGRILVALKPQRNRKAIDDRRATAWRQARSERISGAGVEVPHRNDSAVGQGYVGNRSRG